MKGWNAVDSGGSARLLDREPDVTESGGSERGRWRMVQFGLAAAAAIPLLFVGGINGWPWEGEAKAPAIEPAPVATVADPVRIAMAGLKIDAQVDPLAGDGEAGALASPRHGKVGWLEAGPEPGELGRAVVLGHAAGAKAGDKDVFANLGKAKLGDEIVVTTASGATMTFTVDDVTTYEADALPESVYSGSSDGADLALIAPAGKPDAKGNYPDRVVVTAELVK